MIKDIKSISHYASGYDLIRFETCLLEQYGNNDFTEWFKCADDFEPITYYIVNNETVVISDAINGDVLSVESISDFFLESLKYWEETEGGTKNEG